MFGGSGVEGTAWPQPSPYSTDLDKAKEHLAKSGFADGFDVPFSISLGQLDWMEPTALLIIEALGKIGINSTLDKIPSAPRTIATRRWRPWWTRPCTSRWIIPTMRRR